MEGGGTSNFSACDISDPDYEGELTKRSVWLKEWRKRYFILKGNKLFFARAKHEPAHGMIDLADCLTVKSAEDKTNKKFCFEVATPDSTYYMYAENEKQKDEWIGAIGRAIVRFSSSFTCDQDDQDPDQQQQQHLSPLKQQQQHQQQQQQHQQQQQQQH